MELQPEKLNRDELLALVSKLGCDLGATKNKLEATRDELEEKKSIIAQLQRLLYGPRSERRSWDVLCEGQQLLFEDEALELTEDVPSPTTTVKQYERKRRKRPTAVDEQSLLKFDERATVIEYEVPNPNIEGIPEDQLEVVSEKKVYKLVQLSSPYVVLKVIRKVLKEKGTDHLIELPQLPESLQVFERSNFDASFLAGLVTSKFLRHLPLYRQHQWLEAAGIFLDRGNLTRVVHRVGEILEPIYEALMSSVLQSQILAVDETPTPLARNKKSGYFWVFYGDQNELFFLFSPSRKAEVLHNVLEGFEGKLLCDGYAGYSSFVKATSCVGLCQCWSHARREFLKAEKLEPQRTIRVLELIRRLYEVENKARKESSISRLRIREKKARPLVEELFGYLKETVETATMLPSSPFLKAAKYVLKRENELQVFLANPEIPMDTNHVERELRPQAVGRKNWLFHVSEVGARTSAIFYSLIRSCIVADVDPTTYLIDVLHRIQTRGHPARDIESLLPRVWKQRFSEKPIRSMAHKLLLPPVPP